MIRIPNIEMVKVGDLKTDGQKNRRCYMMELDPYYCDVIIQRWENFTGKKAVKL